MIIGRVSRWESSPQLLHERRTLVQALRCAHAQMNACTNTKLYKFMHTTTYTHSRFLANMEKQNAYLFSPKQKRQTDGHMHAVLASVIHRYFTDRYSYFCFSYEPHYYDWRRSKFHYVACFPAIILPGGKSTIEGKNGYAKTRIVDFPRGKLAI